MAGGVAAQQLSFSSYPGELFSDDDFYMTSHKMVVLETTNHIYNFTILQVCVCVWGAATHSRCPTSIPGRSSCDLSRARGVDLYCSRLVLGHSRHALTQAGAVSHSCRKADTARPDGLALLCLPAYCLQGLSPASVPSWLRVRAANLLASDGRSWVEIFKMHNSGTYNNQVCARLRAWCGV
jgi:hypothetical protein